MIPKPNTVTVGVLSDTHLPYRMDRLPDQIHQAFQDVDLILHAGDVDRIEYLDGLTSLAPLHAVRGNPHFKDFSDGGRDLPVEWQLTIAGHSVVINHGGWPGFWSQAGDWFVQYLLRPGQDVLNQRIANRLAQIYPQANLIVFGHTHRPYQTWHNRTLIFNPGAVCPTRRQVPSVGKVYLGPGTVDAEIISLV